jgi:hypothetical protein
MQIDRASWLALRVEQFDERLAAGTLSERDGRQYLAWSNALTRTLRAIGSMPVAERPGAALDAHIAKLARQASGDAA